MKQAAMLYKIAEDEAKTLHDYQMMLDECEDLEDGVKDAVHEMMGDEINHCIIALIYASTVLGIKIAEDDISPDPNEIEVE